jgi:hypothetical protein
VNCMFQQDFTKKKNTFVFVGGFHLGLPLAFTQTEESSGWTEIAAELSAEFLKQGDLYELGSDEYESETKFPLGNPIKLRHKRFFEYFDLPRYLRDEGFPLSKGSYETDNRIWVLPTGIVLVIGMISVDSDRLISLTQFEDKIVETHYPELAYLFVQVAQVALRGIRPGLLNSAIACKSDIQKCLSAIGTLKAFETSEDFLSGRMNPATYIRGNEAFSALLSDILVDVYYLHYRLSNTKERIRIGYVDSEIASPDPSHLLVISIAFSSFVGFLWLVKHLGEQSRVLQDALIGTKELANDVSHDLKLFRIFCLQFINESSPISVRLTGYYMTRLEECWKEFRLIELAGQVNDQLQTLEQMFDWIEEAKKETRNFKIGLAAVLLALISVSAVTAQLVSTIDFGNTVDWQQRVYLIVLGFAVGIICTVTIYLIPHRKKWYRLIRSRRARS